MSTLFLPDVTLLFVEGRDYTLAKRALDHCLNLVNFADYKILTPTLSSVQQHSNFMFEQAYKHVDTEFFLAAQWDGVVWDPSKWTDEFLKYDYIGAPWPPSHLGATNIEYSVGNGGFSLRSKRLYEFIAKDNEFNRWGYEDTELCRNQRHRIEQLGFTFAPFELAWQFSAESNRHEVPEWKHLDLESTSFGMHGLAALHRFLPDLYEEQTNRYSVITGKHS